MQLAEPWSFQNGSKLFGISSCTEYTRIMINSSQFSSSSSLHFRALLVPSSLLYYAIGHMIAHFRDACTTFKLRRSSSILAPTALRRVDHHAR